MIPLSNWIKSRSMLGNDPEFGSEVRLLPDQSNELLQEVSGLIDDVLDNLTTSQVVGLKATMNNASHSWTEQIARRHSSLVSGGLARIECQIAAAVSTTLLPILADRKLHEVIDEFSSTLKKLLPELAAGEITVTSPTYVTECLKQSLNANGIEARIATGENGELTIASGNVVLTAELGAWSEKLHEALRT